MGDPTKVTDIASEQPLGQMLLSLFILNLDYETYTITFFENAYGYCPSEYVDACNTAMNEFVVQMQQAGTVQFVNLKENFFKPLTEA